jgi:hypothetical protein
MALRNGAGSHTITAVYNGNSHFTSTTVSMTEVVSQAATATTVTGSTTTPVLGKPVTLTATVGAVTPGAGRPTGTVTFYDGNTKLGTVAVNVVGRAVLTTSALPLGSDTITATYSGDTNFTSSSGSLPMTINASVVAASLAVQPASAISPASGINDAAIASLLAEWSQDNLDASDSLASALSA